MVVRRSFLLGLSALGTGLLMRAPPALAARLKIRHGWDANVAGPRRADFHVAPDGDDSADGSAAHPLRSVQRGVDLLAARGRGSLALHGGLYRETINLDKLRGSAQNPYRIHRYGRERVTISAAEKLRGWLPCPAEEARAQGLSGGGIFVARLPLGAVRHGALEALNLHEAGHWRSIAVDRADRSDPETTGNADSYYSADFGLDQKGHIKAIRDPRLKGFPEQAMRGVKALVYHKPNVISMVPITGFDPRRGVITLGGGDLKPHLKRKQPVMRYALLGAPWAMDKGTWIARKTAADQVSIYFRPMDPEALANDIEVSLRPHCITLGQARHVELFGIEALRAAGAGRGAGNCIRRTGQQDGQQGEPEAGRGLRLVHCRLGETLSVGPRGLGALFLRNASDLTLQNVTVQHVRGGFGLFLSACSDVDARFLHLGNVSNSPARFFTLRRAVLAFSLFENSARDAHANKFNFYQGSDQILVYGVRCRNVGGYATYQKASNIHFAFCELPCDPRSFNRALVSQNLGPGVGQGGADGSGDPVAGSTFYYWNNTLTCAQSTASGANALNLGPETNSQRHAIFNNVLNGGGLSTIYTRQADRGREVRSHNRYTALAHWQKATLGWHMGRGEKTMSRGAGPVGQGRDMRPVIQSQIAPLFPGFTDWDVDIDGAPVDWTQAPIGARV